MRLDRFIRDRLEHGVYDLFNYTQYTYPAPFDTLGVMIARKAARDFGALRVSADVALMPLEELQAVIYEDLYLNTYQINALNKILEASQADDTTPDKTEVRTYGEDKNTLSYGSTTVTNNVGARSSSDVTGATDGTTTNTNTSYESVTGKVTTTEHSTTQASTNTTSSAAATDSTATSAHTDNTTRAARTDMVETFGGVGLSEAPDYIRRWLAIQNAPVLATLEMLLIESLTIPYYED